MISSRSLRVSKTSRSSLLPSLSPTVTSLQSLGRPGCSEQIRNYRFRIWTYNGFAKGKHCGQDNQQERSSLRKFLQHESNKSIDMVEEFRKIRENSWKANIVSHESMVQQATSCDRAASSRFGPKTFARKYAATNSTGPNDEDYVIDPITNRKVPRNPSTKSGVGNRVSVETETIFQIPVQTFKEDRKRHQLLEKSKEKTGLRQTPALQKETSIEDNDAYDLPFYNAETSALGKKEYPKSEREAQDGIKHRTDSDERLLMEYEQRCKVNYDQPYLYNEPEEWYPRQTTEEEKAITREKLNEDFQKAGEIIERDQQILKKELEQSRLVADERRTREIHRNAEELHARNVANEKDVERQRAERETIRNAEEIHARFIANEQQIEQDRKAREAIRSAEELHEKFIAQEKQVEKERKDREIIRKAEELHNNFIAKEKIVEQERNERKIIQKAEELHNEFVAREKQVEQERKDLETIRKAEELHNDFIAREQQVEQEKKAREAIRKADELHSKFIGSEKVVSDAKRLRDIQQAADDISTRRAANLKAYEESMEKHRKTNDSNRNEKADKQRLAELKLETNQLQIENSELQNHVAHLRGKVNEEISNFGKSIPATKSEPKMTGNFVRDFPDEFQESWKSTDDQTNSLTRTSKVASKSLSSDGGFASGQGSAEAYRRDSRTPRLETSMDRIERTGPSFYLPKVDPVEKAKTDAILRKIQEENDQYSKEPMGLELSYLKECAMYGIGHLPLHIKSYGTSKKDDSSEADSASAAKSTDDAGKKHTETMNAKQEPIVKTVKIIKPEPQATSEPVIEAGTDAFGYSKKPMGLELSYKQECEREGKPIGEVVCIEYGTQSNKKAKDTSESDKQLVSEVRAAYEDNYGVIDDKHRQTPATENKVSEVKDIQENNIQEPNQYKILAYDPTMQSVSTADATSIVVDTAAALTPADVLLRLSNPAKFFPHFGPLQAQGYEIVSGSGDVLVFRKVRAASPELSPKVNQAKKVVNPIDGTEGRPMAATGNFASPTGFVNHDIPVDPPFKSNIDVRREEPVFSGTKSTWADAERESNRKRGGRGKRLLVGAVSFGACSYAIGVVSEFFRTGGSDGLGAVGF